MVSLEFVRAAGSSKAEEEEARQVGGVGSTKAEEEEARQVGGVGSTKAEEEEARQVGGVGSSKAEEEEEARQVGGVGSSKADEEVGQVIKNRIAVSEELAAIARALTFAGLKIKSIPEFLVPDFTLRSVFHTNLKEIKKADGPVFIDINILASEDGPVLKEISVRCPLQPIAWMLVSPPFHGVPVVGLNNYRLYRGHGIKWDEGASSSEELREQLEGLFAQAKRKFFVNGHSKIDFLCKSLGLPKEQTKDTNKVVNHVEIRKLIVRYDNDACQFHKRNRFDRGNMSCTTKTTALLMDHYPW